MAEATAEMAVFLILAVLRDTYRRERGARDGTWKKDLVPSRVPTGLTLGIVGMGAIGNVSLHTVFGRWPRLQTGYPRLQ